MPLNRQRKKERKLKKNIYNTNTSGQILPTLNNKDMSLQQTEMKESSCNQEEHKTFPTNTTITQIEGLQQKPYVTKNKQKTLTRKRNREAKMYYKDVESICMFRE